MEEKDFDKNIINIFAAHHKAKTNEDKKPLFYKSGFLHEQN